VGKPRTAGYLTSFTETDPIFSASPSFGITGTNITNWNTAFGWGNHASAGYLTSFTELDPTWDGPANFTGDINRTGNVGIGGAPSEKLHVTGNVRATTGFIANDGTVGTPAIRFSTSPTTGIYRQAADAIGVSTAGVERIRVIADGKVGIGLTADPTERMEIGGNVKLTAGANREITVAMESSTANGPLAKNLLVRAGNANFNDNGYAQRGGDLVLQAGRGFTNTVANAHGGHVILRSGANHLNSGSEKNGGDIILETGGPANAVTERMRFTDTGVLTLPTINTSGETRLLQITSSGVVGVAGATGVQGYWTRTGTNLHNTTLADNVGIGTASPGQKLTIEGTEPIAEIRSGGFLMLRRTDNNWDMRLQNVALRMDVLSGGSLGAPIASFVHGGNVGIGTIAPDQRLDVNGGFALREGNALSLANGSNNNVAATGAAFYRVTGPTAAFTITGLAGGTDGRIVTLYNTTTQRMTVANNSVSSTDANRILTLTGANMTTPPGPNALQLQYNSTLQRWLVIGGQNVSNASAAANTLIYSVSGF
jgi:hypothetical protein